MERIIKLKCPRCGEELTLPAKSFFVSCPKCNLVLTQTTDGFLTLESVYTQDLLTKRLAALTNTDSKYIKITEQSEQYYVYAAYWGHTTLNFGDVKEPLEYIYPKIIPQFNVPSAEQELYKNIAMAYDDSNLKEFVLASDFESACKYVPSMVEHPMPTSPQVDLNTIKKLTQEAAWPLLKKHNDISQVKDVVYTFNPRIDAFLVGLPVTFVSFTAISRGVEKQYFAKMHATKFAVIEYVTEINEKTNNAVVGKEIIPYNAEEQLVTLVKEKSKYTTIENIITYAIPIGIFAILAILATIFEIFFDDTKTFIPYLGCAILSIPSWLVLAAGFAQANERTFANDLKFSTNRYTILESKEIIQNKIKNDTFQISHIIPAIIAFIILLFIYVYISSDTATQLAKNSFIFTALNAIISLILGISWLVAIWVVICLILGVISAICSTSNPNH